MVAEVHGGPANPTSVHDEVGSELGEAMGHEESLENRVGGVERREGTEGNRRGAEVGCVEVNAEDLVNASKSSGGSRHAVRSGLEAVLHLIPRGRAGEEQLDGDTENTHPTKGASPDWGSARGSKDEHNQSADDRSAKVAQAVGDPCENIED